MGRTSIQAAHIDGQYRKKAAKSRMSDISKSAHTHTHAFSLVVGEHSVVCGGGGGEGGECIGAALRAGGVLRLPGGWRTAVRLVVDHSG